MQLGQKVKYNSGKSQVALNHMHNKKGFSTGGTVTSKEVPPYYQCDYRNCCFPAIDNRIDHDIRKLWLKD